MTDERLNEIRALAESVAGMNPDEAYASVDRLADAITDLLAVIAERDAEIAALHERTDNLTEEIQNLRDESDFADHDEMCRAAMRHDGGQP